jgi:hypothetical protein
MMNGLFHLQAKAGAIDEKLLSHSKADLTSLHNSHRPPEKIKIHVALFFK